MHTPTSSPLARKRPPPDRPCSGIFSVMKTRRGSRLSLNSSVAVSISFVRQLVNLLPLSIPIDVTIESSAGSSSCCVNLAIVRMPPIPVDTHDRQISRGIMSGDLPFEHARPNAGVAGFRSMPRLYRWSSINTGPRAFKTCAAVKTSVSPSIDAMIVPLPADVPLRTMTVGR